MNEEAWRNLERKVDEVHTAVVGDERLGHPGLVRRVGRLEDWRDSLTLKIAGVSGVVTGIGLVVQWLLR